MMQPVEIKLEPTKRIFGIDNNYRYKELQSNIHQCQPNSHRSCRKIVVCNNLLWLLTIFSIKTSQNMRYFAGLFGDSEYY